MIVSQPWLLAALAVVAAAPVELRPAEAQTMPSSEIQRRIEQVCACLLTPVVDQNDTQPCQTLQDRMAADHVPGVSIAVIHGGAIEWARGFGVTQPGGTPVTDQTMFQAGSISKPVAAMAALRMVQNGRLSLNADVNQALTSWKIPQREGAGEEHVTLRELLNHTSGLTVGGFPGYSPGARLPTLVEVLNGEAPANTDPIRLDSPPGRRFRYSGGGYTVVQQLLIDVSGEPFPHLLHDTVLAPIGMTRSTYEQPLPAARWTDVAMPHRADGTPVTGGPHTYPEMAAAGLWTTPTDLARYVIEIQRSLRGDAHGVLSTDMIKEMLVAGRGPYGLGLIIGGSPDAPYFSHGGINAGYEASLFGYARAGEGTVVMTNAQGGQPLADAVIRSIAYVYGWPDLRPLSRVSVAVNPAILEAFVGVYDFSPTLSVAITLEGGRLMEQVSGRPKLPIFPESPSRFFLKQVNAELEFVTEATGQVSHLVWTQQGQDTRGERRR